MKEQTLNTPTPFERKLEGFGVALGVLVGLAIEILLYPWSLRPIAGALCTLLAACVGYWIGYFPTTLPRRWRTKKEKK
jgi:hypothetical protein